MGNWFDVEVVDQPGFAEEGGQEDVAGSADAGDGLERVGVYDFGVVEGRARFGGQDFLHRGLQRQGVASARGEFVACGGEGTIEDEGGFAFFGIEIDVAGGEGETVGFADDGADYDFDAEVQIARHLRDDADLLRVFAAKVGEIGLDDFEKFQDDGGDAAEMAGTRAAFEAIAEAFDVDVGAKAGRIMSAGCGAKMASTPTAASLAESASKVRGYFERSSLGPNCVG